MGVGVGVTTTGVGVGVGVGLSMTTNVFSTFKTLNTPSQVKATK